MNNVKVRKVKVKTNKIHWRIGLTVAMVGLTVVSIYISFHPAVLACASGCINLIWLWEV